MARTVDDVLDQRVMDALKVEGYEVAKLIRVFPPLDTGGLVEAWFVTTDGHLGWQWLEQWRDGVVTRYRVVSDP